MRFLTAMAGVILALVMMTGAARAACTGPAGGGGDVVYNSDNKVFQYCDGTSWVAMNTPGTGSGGCSNPVLTEGRIVYNEDHRVLQGCAGSVHKAFGPPGGVRQWVDIATGYGHGCGIKDDGTAWCWGGNALGQLGNGTTNDAVGPYPVAGGHTWKSIAVSGELTGSHTCAIRADDTLWCWGRNANGRTGLNTAAGNTTSPTQVSGGGTWTDVAAGSRHTCAIKSDSTLHCWGSNANGRTGLNTTAGDTLVPTQVTGGGAWKSVSAKGDQACAIKTDDTLHCWGNNSWGQLGDNSTAQKLVPTGVNGGGSWKKVSSGISATCAIKSDDSAWCWGANAYGQLGDNTTGQRQVPTAISGGGMWVDISSGQQHSCGLKNDGSAWCWGANFYGAAGHTTAPLTLVPAAVDGGHSWSKIVAGVGSGVLVGALHSCGIKTDGSMRCWGFAGGPTTFFGGVPYSPYPEAVAGGGTWKGLNNGPGPSGYACGIKSDDTIHCWGQAGFGEGSLGYGVVTGNGLYNRPYPITGGMTWKQIGGGGQVHACAIRSDDTAYCWGDGSDGRLGTGSSADQSSPTIVTGGFTWKQVAAGTAHTCAIRSNDAAYCWGDGSYGQRGDGSTSGTQASPVLVLGGSTWKQITAGGSHSCGIKMDDTLWCWGPDFSGEVGNGSTSGTQSSPVTVSGGGTWKRVSAGSIHVCAIKSNDSLWCWGDNGNGQLGLGDTTDRVDPTEVSGEAWKAVYAGVNSTCAIKMDDTAWCWGQNNAGQLGDTSTTQRSRPVQVAGGGTWKDLKLAGDFTCGIKSDDTAWCWGSNDTGGIGSGAEGAAIPAPKVTRCGAPLGKPGSLVFSSGSGVDMMQYCDGVSWTAIGDPNALAAPADPCAGSPAAGTVCADGTVYAGLSTDGSVPMYVTRCDAGQSWGGASCTGTRSTFTWNDGATNWIQTFLTDVDTGESNSGFLGTMDANGGAPGVQEHVAAKYCEDLVANGHSDWYLPARNELRDVICTNMSADGTFDTSGMFYYWSSSEAGLNSSRRVNFNDCTTNAPTKTFSYNVRCARK